MKCTLTMFGPIIGGLVTIFVFLMGVKYRKWEEQEKNNKKYLELEQFFFQVVRFLNFAIDHQVNEMHKCSQRLKDFNEQSLRISILPQLSIDDIRSIKNVDLYRIIVSNKEGNIDEKSSDYLNIQSCFRHIKNFEKSCSIFNDNLSLRLEEYRNNWNINFKELNLLYNAFAQAANLEGKKSDEFLYFFHQIIITKQKEIIKAGQNNNLEVCHRNLIQPLMDYVAENKNKKDPRPNQLIMPLMGCNSAFKETMVLRNQKSKQILEIKEKLIEVKTLLNECVNNVKNRKRRFTY